MLISNMHGHLGMGILMYFVVLIYFIYLFFIPRWRDANKDD